MTKKPFTVANEWQEFERRVLANVTSQVQRDEMRKAFYCGALVLFYGIINGIDPRTPKATDADLSLIDSLCAELDAFRAEMAERRRAPGGGEWH